MWPFYSPIILQLFKNVNTFYGFFEKKLNEIKKRALSCSLSLAFSWSRVSALPRRPAAYKAAALLTELTRHKRNIPNIARLSKFCYNGLRCWSRLVAMTRDCKSLAFGLRRFESYLQHQNLQFCWKIRTRFSNRVLPPAPRFNKRVEKAGHRFSLRSKRVLPPAPVPS